MKKNIALSIMLGLSSLASTAHAELVAIVFNQTPNNYIIDPNAGGGDGSTPISPTAIKTISCTWGECVGAYYSGQAFYVDGKSGSVSISDSTTLNNTEKSFAAINQLFVLDSGKLYGRGSNYYGSIGVNSSDRDINTLTEVVGLNGLVVDFMAGRNSIALTTDGLYYAGDNFLSSGVYFDDSSKTLKNQLSFKKFVDSSSITKMALNENSFAYIESGKLFVKGGNKSGMFGIGSGSVGSNIDTAQEVSGITGVIDVEIALDFGSEGRMFLLKDGTLWAAGDDAERMGLGKYESNVTTFEDTGFAISELNVIADSSTTLLIKDNVLYYAGSNPFGDNFSDRFIVLEETKDIPVKEFVNDANSGSLQVLTKDGRIIKSAYTADFEDTFEIVEQPSFGG